MSLYSSNVTLPVRQDRTFLSIGAEHSRGMIPNCANTTELSEFTHSIIYWKMTTPAIYTQTRLAAALISILVAVACAITLRRIYEGNFWILRVIRRPQGSIIVPNPMLAFCVGEGIFGAVFVPLVFTQLRNFEDNRGFVANLMIWILVAWSPLVYGTAWAALGTYFATPNTLHSSMDGKKASLFGRLMLYPQFVNFLGLILPTFMSVSVVPSAILSNMHWIRATRMELKWQQEYSNATVFTQEMVQDSQDIWLEALTSMRIAAITFIPWTAYAFTLCFSYVYVSLSLILSIYAELIRVRQLDQISQVSEKEGIVSRIVNVATGNKRLADVEEAEEQEEEVVVEEEENGDTFKNLLPTQTTMDEGIKQQKRKVEAARIKAHKSSIGKNLKHVLIHVLIQLLAIASGAGGLGALALTLTLTMYGMLEQPFHTTGNEFEKAFGDIFVAAIWALCFLGGLSLVAVAHKTYEPVFNTSTMDNPHTFIGRFNFGHLFKPIQAAAVAATSAATGLNDRKAHTQSSFFETQSHFFETHSHVVAPERYFAPPSRRMLDNVRRQKLNQMNETEMTLRVQDRNSLQTRAMEKTWDIEAKTECSPNGSIESAKEASAL